MSEDLISDALQAVSVVDSDDEAKVIIDDESLILSKSFLLKEFAYFKAWNNFSQDNELSLYSIKGGVSSDVFKALVDLISKGDDQPARDLRDIGNEEELRDLLHGAIFLQCAKAEQIVVEMLISRSDTIHNSYKNFFLAQECACQELSTKSEAILLDSIRTLNFQPNGILSLLNLSLNEITDVLTRHIVDSTVAFYTALAWIEHDVINRKDHFRDLMRICTLELVCDTQNVRALDDDLDSELDQVKELIEQYRALSLREKVKYWNDSRRHCPKWPKINIVCSIYVKQTLSAFWTCFTSSLWQNLTHKPTRELRLRGQFSSFASCLGKDEIYLFDSDTYMRLWIYDLTRDVWRPNVLNSSEQGIIKCASICHEGTIYIFGGYFDTVSLETLYQRSVLRLDMKKKSLEFVADMPSARCGARVISYGNKIYLFGGTNHFSTLDKDCLEFDPRTRSFRIFTHLPKLVTDFGICLVQNKVYLVGGMDPLTLEALRTVIVWDLQQESWDVSFPKLNFSRKSCGVFFDGQTISAVGGMNVQGFKWVRPVERLDLKTNAWIVREHVPKSLQFCLAAGECRAPVRLMGKNTELGHSNVSP